MRRARAARCRRPRPNRSRRRHRSGRAARSAACRRPRRRTAGRPSAGPRPRRRAPAAPGRRASSRSAARASRRPPSSGGSRPPGGRACRRAPSPAASAAPCRAARPRRCGRARAAGTVSSLGRGNFGALPKPPRRRSKAAENSATALSSASGPGTAPAPPGLPVRCAAARRWRGRPFELVALLAPGAGQLRQDLHEPRPSPPARRRKVGAAVERLQRRRQPHAHRPPAGPGGGLDEQHVDAVHVGPLFAVHLDRHEVLVEHLRHAGILEALVLHHVAPVAGRIPDREEDRPVLGARAREGRFAPGVPVHRVVLMLEQIRAVLRRETIGHERTLRRLR